MGTFLLVAILPTVLHGHLALLDASPTPEEHLVAAPDVLRLTFNEPVELGLSAITLVGPGGAAVALGNLTAGGTGEVLTVSIEGRIEAGLHRVVWQAVGADGHPVRGEFSFTVDAAAVDPVEEDPADDSQVVPPPAVAIPPTPSFSERSPLYAGVRWLMYVGMIGAMGALGFAALLGTARLRSAPPAFLEQARKGAAAFGILSTLPLTLSIPLRIQAQSHSIFGGGVTRERFAALLDSTWGTGWLVQAIGCALVLAGLLTARAGPRAGWVIAGIGTVAIVAGPAMSGHAASAESMRAIAITADGLHMLGAGFWIGTLSAILLVGVPLSRSQSAGERTAVLAGLVAAFSPLALAAAGILVIAGGVVASMHLSSPADLWTTGYGRLLAAKLFIVALTLGLGAFNWRRTRPRLSEAGGDARLRRAGGAEVVAALIVIMLTAVLVAVQPPARTATGHPSHPTIGAMGN